jgi:hypothetical protein
MPVSELLTAEQMELLNGKSPKEMAKALAIANAGYWAELNCLKLPSGEFKFDKHEYLEEPLNGPADKEVRAYQRCYMKAPQGGFSIVEAIDNFHGMIHGRYPQGVLHLLPTKSAVEEFGKAKYGPIISRNKTAIGNYIKRPGGKAADSASMKQIGDAFLYLRSATLNPDSEGDGKTSVPLSSISCDKVDFDEIELMDQESIAKAKGRTGHSDNPEFCYIFNPGGEDSGGDLIWKKSDQRHWYRKCDCVRGDLSAWTCAELEFPDCVKEYDDSIDRARERKHRGYVACKNCGKPLPFYNGSGTGMWVPSKPHIVDFEGYRWSHLTSVFHDPLDILNEFEDPPYGNIGDVYRLRLGLPYSSAEDKLKIDVVLRCCGDRLALTKHSGPCCAGVDVGKIKHLTIGYKTDKEKFTVIRFAALKSFDDIYEMFLRYGVKKAVVDIRPYEDEARAFQKKCKKANIEVFLCEYGDNPTQEGEFNDNTGIVKTYRTGILDRSHRYLSNGAITLPSIQSPKIRWFAEQCCNMEKYKDTNRYGQEIFRYRPCGDRTVGDHFRHTLNYFILAAGRAPTMRAKGFQRQTKCISD